MVENLMFPKYCKSNTLTVNCTSIPIIFNLCVTVYQLAVIVKAKKKLINSFSGTVASLKSSPHQPFLFNVFPDYSYRIMFGFLFHRNNNKCLSD